MQVKSEFIKFRLKELGKTQEELGFFLGTPKSGLQVVNHILRTGKTSIKNTKLIAQFLKCSVREIMNDEDLNQAISYTLEKANEIESQVNDAAEKMEMYKAMIQIQGSNINDKDIIINELRKQIEDLKNTINQLTSKK